MVADVRDKCCRCAADKIQQVDAAGNILVDAGEAGQVKDQQGTSTDAEAADDPGEKADEKSQNIHSSSTARIPP